MPRQCLSTIGRRRDPTVRSLLAFRCILSTAFYRPGVMPIRGANRSKLSATRPCAFHEHAYPQFVLKTGKAEARRLEPIAQIQSYGKNKLDDARAARRTNRKGCDIGYVPAICSCEGAYSVDPCTVAALDAITAFAVPNPNCSSQSQPVFSGPVALQVALTSGSLSLLRTGKFYFANPFSRRRKTN